MAHHHDGSGTVFPEAGYTPANLLALLADARLSRPDAASILSVSRHTVDGWCAELDDDRHQDMPLIQWRELVTNAHWKKRADEANRLAEGRGLFGMDDAEAMARAADLRRELGCPRIRWIQSRRWIDGFEFKNPDWGFQWDF